jgi:hypothetical protein
MKKLIFEKNNFPVAPGGNIYEWKDAETKFEIPKNGKYVIMITASVRNGEQNETGDDDDLRVIINGFEFGKNEIHTEKVSYQGFGSSASFDGATLKGAEKSIYFFVDLDSEIEKIFWFDNKREQVVKFFADGKPEIKSLKVYEITGDYFDILPEDVQSIKTNQKGIPWKSFVFIANRPEKISLYINCKSSSQKKTTDGDNVKIIINGEILQNKKSLISDKYKNFYFSGDLDKGETKKLDLENCFGKYENAVEIWYDETPIFGVIEIWLSSQINFRKKSIIKNTPAEFIIEENISAYGGKPIYERYSKEQVKENEEYIIIYSKKYNLDTDFVRAIIYMESTHGWYDSYCGKYNPKCLEAFSILPMNILVDYWKDLGFTREDLKNPEKNIEAGCILLRRIWDRVKNPTIEKVASIYNLLGTTKVLDYGMRVRKIYDLKLWNEN